MPESNVWLSTRTRLLIATVSVTLVLLFINFEIAGKRKIVEEGRQVLLQLAPRDPRSLLQGDYMALRYAMAEQVATAARTAGVMDGFAIISLDSDAKAGFVAIHQNQQLAEGQHLLRFRRRGESVRLASDAFFFEEGQWNQYSTARYGELRVNANGDAVLIGLRDADRNPLGTAAHEL